MQTNALTQLNLNGAPPGQRNGAALNSDAAQFSAMLSNELAQRQPAPPVAPAPAPKPEAPKPKAADKPGQPEDPSVRPAGKADEAAQPASADKAAEAQDAGQTGNSEQASDEQTDEAADPAAAMLALMASLQQPAQDAKADPKASAAPAQAQAFDALNGAGGKGRRGEVAQLASLQAAMKSVARDGTGVAATAGKAFSDTESLRNPALAAAGAALGADDRPALAPEAGARLGADLRAALAAAGSQEQLEQKLDTAALALQQAREAELSRSAAPQPVAVAVAALAQAQPAVMETVQAAAAAAEGLSARVGTEAWERQVGQKVVYMLGSEEQTASLTLNPPDLGPLQVVLSVSNDQASVSFSANQEEVRQALEDALPRLREMMSESGIALGNASVNAGMPDSGQAREQAARNGGGSNRNGRGRGDGSNAVEETVTRTAVLGGDRGMVDTFV